MKNLDFRHILKVSLENILLLLGIYALFIYPAVIALLIGADYFYFGYIVRNLFWVLPLATLILLLTNKTLIKIITVIIALGAALETGMAVLYGEFVAAGNIVSIINTNTEEAMGFLSVSLRALWYFIPIILLVIGEFYALNKFKPSPIFNGIFTIIFAIVVTIGVDAKRKTIFTGEEVKASVYIREAVLMYPPYNAIYQSSLATKFYRGMKASSTFSFEAEKADSTAKKEVYVLAFGESLRYKNVSLNGQYERTTTPLLEARDNVVLYNNYYSPACITAFSIPIMMSRATSNNFALNFEEGSIIDVYKEAGFKTFIIANSYNTLSEVNNLTINADSMIVVENDGEIPAILHSVAEQYDKVFCVLHFYGNHLVYKNYTPEFDVYQPSIYHMANPPKDNIELNTNSYDNTILYVDYLLDTMMSQLDSMNVVSSFIFTSDHGENISANVIGHGYTNHPPKDEYHIPLIIWYSDEWKAQYPQKEFNLEKHIDYPINGENIFYSACDVANITLDSTYANQYWSIYNDSLSYHDRYILMRDGTSILKVE